jgi:hypothetical protein
MTRQPSHITIQSGAQHSGDQIVLSVTGLDGTYTLIDTDSGGNPGVFWASHGSACSFETKTAQSAR